MRPGHLGRGILIAGAITANSTAAMAQQPAVQPQENVYVYYYEELSNSQSTLPLGLRQVRQQSSIFDQCRAAQAQVAPALVPLILFGVKLFGSIIDRHLSDREARRLESLSRTYAQVRTDSAFPIGPSSPRLRCLVVDRGTQSGSTYQPGAVYVIGLRPVDSSGFTIEPIAARIDASSFMTRARDRLNATVSLTVQSVVTNREGTNELVTLPAFSMTFRNLAAASDSRPPARRSPVMPVVRATGAPTSVAVAVTEAHASLEQIKQQVALEQANRAALLAAIGETVKAAITD